MGKAIYVPNQRDLIWIDFDPSIGKEITKRRPALVISNHDFNYATMFCIVCPITSTHLVNKLRIDISKDCKVKGQVLLSQIKSVDFFQRKAEFIDKLPLEDYAKVQELLSYIL